MSEILFEIIKGMYVDAIISKWTWRNYKIAVTDYHFEIR